MLSSLLPELLQGVKKYILVPAQILHLVQHKDMVDLPPHVHFQLARGVLVQAFIPPDLLLPPNVDILPNRPQQILNWFEDWGLEESLKVLLPVGMAHNQYAPILNNLG